MKKTNSKEQDIRIEKLATLQSLGIEPYPAEAFFVNTTTQAVIKNYGEDPNKYVDVKIAGRLMSRRIMGGVSFGEIEDEVGKIQIYIKKDTLCPDGDKTLYDQVFRKLLDIGDIIGIEGHAFVTKMGTLAINIKKLLLLAKAIRPLPVVKEVKTETGEKRYYTFSDPEQRYRQRYIDLVLNPEIKKIFEIRASIIRLIRNSLHESGYLEVETPILQPIYGGATARPFTTHHHTLDMPLFLRISHELYLKRLIVGGYKGVYEFAKCFRNEGMSRFHNPEFTMLEVYIAYKDYYWGMDYIENILKNVVKNIHGTTAVQVGEQKIDFGNPWQRLTIYEAIKKFTGIDINGMSEQELYKCAQKCGITIESPISKGKIIDELFSTQCEPHFIQPTFIMDYPLEMSPLAKQHRSHPGLVERFELICNGKEICNAYSELNDPLEQQKRFQEQQAMKDKGDEESMMLDRDFLRALSYGMPPTFGWGLGIDRFSMILANVSSIQEVVFFPQMRKES